MEIGVWPRPMPSIHSFSRKIRMGDGLIEAACSHLDGVFNAAKVDA
jgi:hypothetical protein